MMKYIKNSDPEIYAAIKNEVRRQQDNLELIASENFTSLAVLEAQGSVLTNKYAEGYPMARWYGGCVNVDQVEKLAIDRAKELFGAEHVNVQAHSGTQANMAAYLAVLNPGDTVLAMDLGCGGHLSHGHPQNFSGKFFKVYTYCVDQEKEVLDYDSILSLAKKCRPKLILAGASAYPRIIDFKAFRKICDATGAYFLADMAHIAGLVAAGMHPSPVGYADFVSSTTHKTLRGPRGGFLICKKEFAKKIDSQIFPGIQGGPLMHVIAAKAVAFKEAMSREFKEYQKQILINSKELADCLTQRGFRIVSGGTDTHLLLVDLTKTGIVGSEASHILEQVCITVNKNLIPFDKRGPSTTSGIRIGSAAVTTRGMKATQMRLVAQLIADALEAKDDLAKLKLIRDKVIVLTKKFPLYPELLKEGAPFDCASCSQYVSPKATECSQSAGLS